MRRAGRIGHQFLGGEHEAFFFVHGWNLSGKRGLVLELLNSWRREEGEVDQSGARILIFFTSSSEGGFS